MARWIAALAVAAGLAAPGSALAAETTKLETNAAATPLGIDDAKPKLSWRLDGSERGLKQTGYRIVVATTAARAAAGDGNVWDSGEVASANPYAEYSGPRSPPARATTGPSGPTSPAGRRRAGSRPPT